MGERPRWRERWKWEREKKGREKDQAREKEGENQEKESNMVLARVNMELGLQCTEEDVEHPNIGMGFHDGEGDEDSSAAGTHEPHSIFLDGSMNLFENAESEHATHLNALHTQW